MHSHWPRSNETKSTADKTVDTLSNHPMGSCPSLRADRKIKNKRGRVSEKADVRFRGSGACLQACARSGTPYLPNHPDGQSLTLPKKLVFTNKEKYLYDVTRPFIC